MDRLTKNNREDNKGDYYYPECLERCDGFGTSEKCDECDFCYAVCEKLGKYEDLEEQGLLFRLPCKEGDTVYAIDGKNIQKLKAKNDIALISGRLCIFAENRHYADYICYDDIGKTVFLTQAEAEQKLKEMESKQGFIEVKENNYGK